MQEFMMLALKNVAHRKMRSWLTILGIFIGIIAIVSLVSLSGGLKRAVQEEFSKFGVDKIIIAPQTLGGAIGASSVILDDHDLDRIRKTRGVQSVTGALFRSGKALFENKVRYPSITGFDLEGEMDILDDFGFLEVEAGRTLKQGDTRVALAGNTFAYGKLFSRDLHVGDLIKLENKSVEIVGILKRTGDPGYDAGITMNYKEAKDLFDLKTQYDVIYVKVNEGSSVDVVAESVARNLRRLRGVDERKEDFTVETSLDLAKRLFTILNIISAVLVGIAAISLFVGAVGIMNTMYTAVLERTNEIGVMKALGARRGDILLLFTLESGFLGFVGGLVGVVLGIGTSKLIAFVGAQATGSQLIQAYFPGSLILCSLLFAFLLGAASGVLPAYQAARMRPVESLRY